MRQLKDRFRKFEGRLIRLYQLDNIYFHCYLFIIKYLKIIQLTKLKNPSLIPIIIFLYNVLTN